MNQTKFNFDGYCRMRERVDDSDGSQIKNYDHEKAYSLKTCATDKKREKTHTEKGIDSNNTHPPPPHTHTHTQYD